jgi:hypothetical protein
MVVACAKGGDYLSTGGSTNETWTFIGLKKQQYKPNPGRILALGNTAFKGANAYGEVHVYGRPFPRQSRGSPLLGTVGDLRISR